MKLTRSFLAIFLSLSLVSVSFLSLAIQSASAQDTKIALQRGYRTGYSDGYMSGYRDVIDNTAKSYERHSEYSKADRAYNKEYGTLEDYRDGYQQGFETGYNTGFEKRSFDATIPSDLNKRGVLQVRTTTETTVTTPVATTTTPTETVSNSTIITTPTETNTQPVYESTTTVATTTMPSETMSSSSQQPVTSNRTENTINTPVYDTQSVTIPTDTELIVELLDDLNTDRNREGDKFTAKVISPYELSGAIIEGRVSKIQKPGRIKRRSQLLLSFDRIVMLENRWSNFNAILTEVLPTKGDNVKMVDTEGTALGKSSIKDDSIKVGATTGTGLVIGAIAGGPVGAAVGAGVGAAFGVGAVVMERGKHIRLNKNQQLRIKTVYETQIR
ncbi:MAG: hypothetical protein ABWZ66_12680 [Pyrinomonadaceae bacterium]